MAAKNDAKSIPTPSLSIQESNISGELDRLRQEIKRDQAALNDVLMPIEQLRFRARVAETALKSAGMLASIVSGSQDAIIAKNLDGAITSWNLGAQRILGYTAQESIGQPIDFMLPPGHLDEEALILNKIRNGEQVSSFESERVSKDGLLVPVSITASPIFNSNSKVVGVSQILRDITIQKKDTQALLDANKRLLFEYTDKAKREAELVTAKDKLQASLMETIDLARQLTELRDPFTAGHEKHVGDLAKAIAAQMGFDEIYQRGMMIAGYLHDTGKIIVPIEILCKPGNLSREEFNLVKNHVQAGYDLLKDVTYPWPIAKSVLGHHERLDGSGYPNGLKSDQISLESRILAVADVIDAMASHRPYRAALGIEKALAEIELGRETIYDGAVVDACLTLFREKGYTLNGTQPSNYS